MGANVEETVEHLNETQIDLIAENDRLKGSLRAITDYLAELLSDGRFPNKGRSTYTVEHFQSWWEDRVGSVQKAYSVLAGLESVGPWTERHPGLYIPPPGLIRFEDPVAGRPDDTEATDHA